MGRVRARHRVIAMPAPRMAAAQAMDGQIATPQAPVPVQSL